MKNKTKTKQCLRLGEIKNAQDRIDGWMEQLIDGTGPSTQNKFTNDEKVIDTLSSKRTSATRFCEKSLLKLFV